MGTKGLLARGLNHQLEFENKIILVYLRVVQRNPWDGFATAGGLHSIEEALLVPPSTPGIESQLHQDFFLFIAWCVKSIEIEATQC